MKIRDKHWQAVSDGESRYLPRKIKKAILGKRIGRERLGRMIRAALGKRTDLFCPKCGCVVDYSTGNMAGYPEHWEKSYCARCGDLVGEIDNSEFMHVLDFPETYRIEI